MPFLFSQAATVCANHMPRWRLFSFLLGGLPASQLNKCLKERRPRPAKRPQRENKWMFDISPVCQDNLALWHAITGLITAVCGLEGTQAGLATLTGPDRLIRSVGTHNCQSQTPHIYSLAHEGLQVQEALFSTLVPWHLLFGFSPSTSDVLDPVTSPSHPGVKFLKTKHNMFLV